MSQMDSVGRGVQRRGGGRATTRPRRVYQVSRAKKGGALSQVPTYMPARQSMTTPPLSLGGPPTRRASSDVMPGAYIAPWPPPTHPLLQCTITPSGIEGEPHACRRQRGARDSRQSMALALAEALTLTLTDTGRVGNELMNGCSTRRDKRPTLRLRSEPADRYHASPHVTCRRQPRDQSTSTSEPTPGGLVGLRLYYRLPTPLGVCPHDFKILAAAKIASLVLPTHSLASSTSSSKVMLSVIPGNVTGAYPVSLPGANSVFW